MKRILFSTVSLFYSLLSLFSGKENNGTTFADQLDRVQKWAIERNKNGQPVYVLLGAKWGDKSTLLLNKEEWLFIDINEHKNKDTFYLRFDFTELPNLRKMAEILNNKVDKVYMDTGVSPLFLVTPDSIGTFYAMLKNGGKFIFNDVGVSRLFKLLSKEISDKNEWKKYVTQVNFDYSNPRKMPLLSLPKINFPFFERYNHQSSGTTKPLIISDDSCNELSLIEGDSFFVSLSKRNTIYCYHIMSNVFGYNYVKVYSQTEDSDGKMFLPNVKSGYQRIIIATKAQN